MKIKNTKEFDLIMNILAVTTLISLMAMFITGTIYTQVRTTEMLNIAASFAIFSGIGMYIGFMHG